MEITLEENGAVLRRGRLPNDNSFAIPDLKDYGHSHQITGAVIPRKREFLSLLPQMKNQMDTDKTQQ